MSGMVPIERRGAIAVVVLDNPPVNALANAALDALTAAADDELALAGDTEIRAAVLTGAGNRSFAAWPTWGSSRRARQPRMAREPSPPLSPGI